MPLTVPEPEHPDEDEPGLKGYHICVQWPQVSSCQVAVAGVGMDLDLPLKSGMALDFRQLLLCVLVGMVRRLLAVIGMCMQ